MSSNDNPFKQFKRPRKVSATYSLLGAAAAIALLLPSTQADAAMLKLGTVDVQIDTTVSVGVSMLTKEVETQFLPVVNGGPKDEQLYLQPTGDGTPNVGSGATASSGVDAATCADMPAYNTFCQNLTTTMGKPNFDGSINADDGRLNFGKDDLISAPFKVTSEIEIMGFGFNTTAFGWGVQGDFTFRPEMALQFDTDALTIAALFNNCAFALVAGLEPVYQSGATYSNEYADHADMEKRVGCTHDKRYLQGYTTDHDAYTWDIGTTATFTRSNPVVSFLGADLGILLTEFQGVIAEDIEEMRGDTGGIGALGAAQGITPLSNVCQGGSDLPLNGVLSIDDRTVGDAASPNDDNAKGFCRPTDSSWGAVLFAQLQYNNVFGSPFSLNPTLVHSEGLEGYSPSPLGFWREGVGATSFRLDSRYLDKWQMSLSYTAYNGDIERTRNLDRDTLSASVSYAF